jgi:hypothetical protein
VRRPSCSVALRRTTATLFALTSCGGTGTVDVCVCVDHGRNYPVLVNSDGLAVAAPFKCGQTGLFANRAVTPLSVWQPRMGDCSHDPMGGRRRALMGLTVDDGAH